MTTSTPGMPSAMNKPEYTLWCVGLSQQDMDVLHHCASDSCRIHAVDEQQLANGASLDGPDILWVHIDAWKRFQQGHGLKQPTAFSKIAVLHSVPCSDDVSHALESDFHYIVREPLSKASVHKAFGRLLETRNAHDDLRRMKREIYLGREIMLRKSEALAFTLDFIKTISECTSPKECLNVARRLLHRIIPVRRLHGLVWNDSVSQSPVVDIYLDAVSPQSASGQRWQRVLLDAVEDIMQCPVQTGHVEMLRVGMSLMPDGHSPLLLPLKAGNRVCGLIMAQLKRDQSLSKDQAQAIEAVFAYLGMYIQHLLRMEQHEEPHPVLSASG